MASRSSSAIFAHVGITARDPLALEAFYSRHFGYRRANVLHADDGDVVMLRNGDHRLELFGTREEFPAPPHGGTGPTAPGYRHIAFVVDDIEAKLRELGDSVRVTLGPLELDGFAPGMRAVWIADPEGNVIELAQGYLDDPSMDGAP